MTSANGSLRTTVNLHARTVTALGDIDLITGDTQTETINRAVQLYAQVLGAVHRGHEVVESTPDGTAIRTIYADHRLAARNQWHVAPDQP